MRTVRNLNGVVGWVFGGLWAALLVSDVLGQREPMRPAADAQSGIATREPVRGDLEPLHRDSDPLAAEGDAAAVPEALPEHADR